MSAVGVGSGVDEFRAGEGWGAVDPLGAAAHLSPDALTGWGDGLRDGLTKDPESVMAMFEQSFAADAAIIRQRRPESIAAQLAGVAQGGRGMSYDYWLLTQPWGFEASEILVRSRFWHGEEDTLPAPTALVDQIPGATLALLPGGHLSPYAHAETIFSELVSV